MSLAAPLPLVCPKCDRENRYPVDFGMSEWRCPACKKPFQCLLATVRGKRSRGNKKDGRREYSIRVMVGAQEELIEYGTSDYYDFEMRSRDVVAFLSRKGAIYVVHNFTIGQYHRIRKPPNIIAIAILLIIVISALLMVLAANQH